MHSVVASPFKAGYVSAKHGVLGLVKTIALEGASVGISAAAICPGYTRTPLVEEQIAAQAKAHNLPQERVLEDVILAPQAVKRLIEPEEIAEVASFLLGPRWPTFTGVPVSHGPGLDGALNQRGVSRASGPDADVAHSTACPSSGGCE